MYSVVLRTEYSIEKVNWDRNRDSVKPVLWSFYFSTVTL